MNGFVASAEGWAQALLQDAHQLAQVLALPERGPDVMGYHTGARDPELLELRAGTSVLQDHMFEPTTSWSLPSHLDPRLRLVGQVAPGSANPTSLHQRDPGARLAARRAAETGQAATPDYAWTDITYLLHRAPRAVALLTSFKGSPAGLLRRRDVLQADQSRNATTPRHLETRCRGSTR